jgi:hypothetical protein
VHPDTFHSGLAYLHFLGDSFGAIASGFGFNDISSSLLALKLYSSFPCQFDGYIKSKVSGLYKPPANFATFKYDYNITKLYLKQSI